MPSEEQIMITLSEEERATLVRWLEEKHGQTSVHYRQMIQSMLMRLNGWQPREK